MCNSLSGCHPRLSHIAKEEALIKLRGVLSQIRLDTQKAKASRARVSRARASRARVCRVGEKR